MSKRSMCLQVSDEGAHIRSEGSYIVGERFERIVIIIRRQISPSYGNQTLRRSHRQNTNWKPVGAFRSYDQGGFATLQHRQMTLLIQHTTSKSSYRIFVFVFVYATLTKVYRYLTPAFSKNALIQSRKVRFCPSNINTLK